MGKRKQIWLIHIVGKQKEIRDEASVCILLVPINQEHIGHVVEDHVLIDDLIIDTGYSYLDMCGRHTRKDGRQAHTHPFPFPPIELMSSVASEVKRFRSENAMHRAGAAPARRDLAKA